MTARSAAVEAAPVECEHVFDYEVTLCPPVEFGRGPYGRRVFYGVRGGRVRGPALSGEVVGGGGDWALIGDDGWTRIDVRGQCRTDDGALLFFRYHGVIEPSAAMLAAVRAGGETAFEDQYFRAAVEIETGDERYRWLTQALLIGRGRLCAGPGVAYEIYRVL